MKTQVQEAGIDIKGLKFIISPDGPLLFENVPILKAPWDIETILTIIKEIEPDVIIETGTAYGGSALLYSKVCPQIITIEDRSHYGGDGTKIDPHTMRGYIPVEYTPKKSLGVEYIEKSSIDADTLLRIQEICRYKIVLINLDSDHHCDNVYAELKAYADFVSIGSYFIVEDMQISYIHSRHGWGPDIAVKKFLEEDKRFRVEEKWNKQQSLNFGGYLRRVS